MKKIRMVATMAVMGSMVAFAAVPLQAQQAGPKTPASNQSSAGQERKTEAFLGVAVEAMSPSLAAHLHDTTSKDQGLVVAELDAHSPAAKAGIQQYDILLAYGDQKLFSPEQLVKLVRADKPGATAILDILRSGKRKSIQVILGEQPERSQAWAHRRGTIGSHSGRMDRKPAMRMPRGMASAHHGANRSNWERFDSLTLQKTGKDQFKVTIGYLDDKGKVERHEFQGSRQQIHNDIQKEKDLPASERTHLLAALDMPEHEMVIPGVRFVPGQGLVIDFDDFVPGESQNPSSAPQF